MGTCFVIQPFDKGKFDDRFDDVFKPAIENAGLKPYRVDKDPGVTIPIEDIEKGISEATICFAEITTNNPNVWYELGYAFACKKDVVMICSEERTDPFPFDVRHKLILTYKTGSTRDFTKLGDLITEKLTALLAKNEKLEQLSETVNNETEGLQPNEVALLITILENQPTPEDYASVNHVVIDMDKAGFTEVATYVGLRTLLRKQMITTFITEQGRNNACRLANKGEAWIINNQDKINLTKEQPKNPFDDDDNELPF